MSVNKHSVSIIIPTIRGMEYVKSILCSIDNSFSSSTICYEVIIADDQEESDFKISKYCKDTGYQYIHTGSRGPAWARNAGAKLAIHDYLLFLDDDTTVPDSYAKRLNHVLDSKGWDFAGGPAKPRDTIKLDVVRYYLSSMHLLEKPVYNKCGEIVCFPTVQFLIHHQVFKKIEGFDTSFIYPGGEDNDLYLRLKLAGFKGVFFQELFVYHEYERCLLRFGYTFYRYGYGNGHMCALRGLPQSYSGFIANNNGKLIYALLIIPYYAFYHPFPMPYRRKLFTDIIFRFLSLVRMWSYECGGALGRLRYSQQLNNRT